jgi:predicted TIM-barrel fold metal-dependent hydrolase
MVSAMPGGTLPALARLSARFSFPVIMTAVSYGSAAETLAAGKLAPNLFIESHILSSPGLIELFVAELGADRLVYGSNAPVHYVGSSLAALIHAKISHDDKQAIVRDNILRLTGVRND